MAVIGGMYLSGERLDGVGARTIANSLQEVREMPESFGSLPGDVKAAQAQVVRAWARASAGARAAARDLRQLW